MRPFRVPLESDLAPEEAVAWLRGEDRPFALTGEWLGGLTVMGSCPLEVADPVRDPFSVLEEQPELDGGEAVVGGGWVGWLGYGIGSLVEQLPPSPPAPIPCPSFSLAFYDHVVVYDGERWWFEGLQSAERDALLRERLAVWEERLRVGVAQAVSDRVPAPFVLAANGGRGHLDAVADCRRRIEVGELYQANLCVRLESRYDGDPLDLFARALPVAQPRFGALVGGVVSLSPERFLRREGRDVWTEPIKGTRPRTGSDDDRRAAREALLASTKDAAEHVMIVDLMRNDLGRVCTYGTVHALAPRIEPHAGVWHLVSTVTGRLRDGVRDGELLRASFPPGSVTGAPKVQAMKVIATLEATRREVYTGAIGIASPIAGLDTSVVIRTFETAGDAIWMGVGGAIVADSDPEQELAEALAKAAGPIAAIGGSLGRPLERPAYPPNCACIQGARWSARCSTGSGPIRRSACSRPCSSRTAAPSHSTATWRASPPRWRSCTALRCPRRCSPGPRRWRPRLWPAPGCACSPTPTAPCESPYRLPGRRRRGPWRSSRLLCRVASARTSGAIGTCSTRSPPCAPARFRCSWTRTASCSRPPTRTSGSSRATR